jgi:hypothetical protein
MSLAHQKAMQLRWQSVSKKDRSTRMRKVAQDKWKNISPEQRSLHAKKMRAAQLAK